MNNSTFMVINANSMLPITVLAYILLHVCSMIALYSSTYGIYRFYDMINYTLVTCTNMSELLATILPMASSNSSEFMVSNPASRLGRIKGF